MALRPDVCCGVATTRGDSTASAKGTEVVMSTTGAFERLRALGRTACGAPDRGGPSTPARGPAAPGSCDPRRGPRSGRVGRAHDRPQSAPRRRRSDRPAGSRDVGSASGMPWTGSPRAKRLESGPLRGRPRHTVMTGRWRLVRAGHSPLKVSRHGTAWLDSHPPWYVGSPDGPGPADADGAMDAAVPGGSLGLG